MRWPVCGPYMVKEASLPLPAKVNNKPGPTETVVGRSFEQETKHAKEAMRSIVRMFFIALVPRSARISRDGGSRTQCVLPCFGQLDSSNRYGIGPVCTSRARTVLTDQGTDWDCRTAFGNETQDRVSSTPNLLRD